MIGLSCKDVECIHIYSSKCRLKTEPRMDTTEDHLAKSINSIWITLRNKETNWLQEQNRLKKSSSNSNHS